MTRSEPAVSPANDAELAAHGKAGRNAPGRLAEQRRALPDAPGVYIFRDSSGRVLYVGKAKSIRKRVASHFAGPSSTRGALDMYARVDGVEAVVVGTEAEALLTEQAFIKQYRPQFNIRLRDDKSYPYVAISLDEEFPRVYFTRERHRRDRAYFGPYSSAKRVRETLHVLGKVFQFRSCEGSTPGRRSGSPCLDYYIKRCEAPCVGYVSAERYRQGIDGVADFLSGRFKRIERELREEMNRAADAQEFEQAASARNRLAAVGSLLERQRVANEGVGTLDAVAVAVEGTDANAQVFQLRDGVLADRQSFLVANTPGAGPAEVAESFLLQYYAGSAAIPPLILVAQDSEPTDALAQALADRRDGPVELRVPQRGDKRRILELAERNARFTLDQERLKDQRRRDRRVAALEGLQRALGLDVPPMRVECFDISTLMGAHTVASMVVFEGAVAKKSDYRRFTIRSIESGVPDDFTAMEEVLSRRIGRWRSQSQRAPHDRDHDPSFAALPNVVVIDGGRGQLSAALGPLAEFRRHGVIVVALAKRIEEVFLPGVATPLVLDHETPELQLLQRVRDEAHRFAIEHHRNRRDRAMTDSVLDAVPGIGPGRKRALLAHFGSPDAVLRASREELGAVPGLPGRVARELHGVLHKTG